MPDRRLLVIGRDAGADVVLDDDSVSRFHAELVLAGRHRYLTDRDSLNGTWRWQGESWQRVRQDYVENIDRLRFGDVETSVSELIAGARSTVSEPVVPAEADAQGVAFDVTRGVPIGADRGRG